MNRRLNEIKEIIESNIPSINYHFNTANIKPSTDGLDFVSSEFIKSISNDISIGEKTYCYNFEKLNISDKLYSYVQDMFPEYTPLVSGSFYYPKGGFMSWHTNSDKPETRLYITYVDTPNKSFFRSYVNNSIITDYDDKIINIRMFNISNNAPYYWHCVYSDCNRYSFGFRLFEK
jgi:hypothetical protein